MADFNQRFQGSYTENPTNSSTGRNDYSMSREMSIVRGTELGIALKGKAQDMKASFEKTGSDPDTYVKKSGQ